MRKVCAWCQQPMDEPSDEPCCHGNYDECEVCDSYVEADNSPRHGEGYEDYRRRVGNPAESGEVTTHGICDACFRRQMDSIPLPPVPIPVPQYVPYDWPILQAWEK